MEKTTRNIIRLGGNLVISIPKAYADFYNLKPKSKVIVFTSDNGIFIKPIKPRKRTADPFSHGGGGR